MPWTTLNEPCLGLAILKARLTQHGIPTRVRHFQEFLLTRLRAETYLGIAPKFGLNDFLFTAALDDALDPRQLTELGRHAETLVSEGALGRSEYADTDKMASLLLTLRDDVFPAYLDECAAYVSRHDPTMLGLTCMFDQTIASVALAKLVRERLPEILIVLGGYAVKGVTGITLLQAFPWIDAVCHGEGEDVIVPLALASRDRSLLREVPGVTYRDANGQVCGEVTASRTDINNTPVPDFDDWHADLAELATEHRICPVAYTLPIETSRGCWWGQVHHCVFCGIDDETMRYRVMDHGRALAMLLALRDRYGTKNFRITDYILPVDYFRTLLPALAALDESLCLSCEIKSNMTEQKFEVLRDAGFVEVQPGVESFSTSVLRRMDKGVRAIQNVHTLLMGARNGIRVAYNFLYGFPYDTAGDYMDLLPIMPRLYHLDPPMTHTLVATTRYAPLQVNSARFGITNRLHPHRAYNVLFSSLMLERTGFHTEDYCYYFETPYSFTKDLEDAYRLLAIQLDHWAQLHSERRPQLSFIRRDDNRLTIVDTRYSTQPVVRQLSPEEAAVYIACTPAPVTLEAVISTGRELMMGADEVLGILGELDRARLTFSEGGRVVGLALPAEVYDPSPRRQPHVRAPRYAC